MASYRGATADNIRKFGAESIHNTNNLVEIPDYIHNKITGHYNKKYEWTNNSKPLELGGLTERDWLKTQSFEVQYEYGLDIVQKALNGAL